MPAQTDAISKVYARSLFELAQEAGREKVLEVADEFEQIDELAREDRKFGELLASPVIDPAKRGEALRRIFENRVTDLTLRFMLVLNEKGRLGHLATIATSFDQMVQAEFGKVEVDVFTAAALGPEQRQDIARRVQETLKREPVLHAYTEPGMIGGIKLRIGDQLIDGSVASQLRRMQKDLLDRGPAKLRERSSKLIEDR